MSAVELPTVTVPDHSERTKRNMQLGWKESLTQVQELHSFADLMPRQDMIRKRGLPSAVTLLILKHGQVAPQMSGIV